MLQTWGNFTAKDMRQLLHSVANSQHWNLSFFNELPDSGTDVWGILVIHTGRSSTQNDGDQLVLAKLFGRHQARVELAVDMELTDATRNQVGVLRSEIQDCNLRAVYRDGTIALVRIPTAHAAICSEFGAMA